MRIYLFAQHYPVPYKSYYDTQFVDLLAKGHEITVWAGSGLDRVLNEKVRVFGLAERTRHYPTTLRSLPRFAAAITARIAQHPRWCVRVARTIARTEKSPKHRLMNWARALVLGPAAPDVCIVHELGTAVMFPFLAGIYPNAPTALYYHGGETPIVSQLQRERVADAFRSFDVVFSNTQFSCRHAIDRGCPADRIQTLPVGFAVDDFTPPSARSYRAGGTLQLLSAGRMSEEKGFTYALEAVRILVERGITNIRYALTGEGYLKTTLEEYVRTHHLEPYVHFLGTLSTEEVLNAMLAADVLLLPSLEVGNWAENQACAVQEAMLMKTLVVTTTTGGVPESIPPAFRKFAVPERDAGALADVIAMIYVTSTSDLERLGEVGRKFVLDGYDVSRLNERLLVATLGAHRERARITRATPTRAPAVA